MDRQIDRVVQELDAFLMGESVVHRTLEHLAARLAAMQIDFVLTGSLAYGAKLDRACTPHAPALFVTIHSDW